MGLKVDKDNINNLLDASAKIMNLVLQKILCKVISEKLKNLSVFKMLLTDINLTHSIFNNKFLN